MRAINKTTEYGNETLMKACLYICQNKPPKMINSTSIYVTFGGAVEWEQQNSHSTAPSDEQIIKYYSQLFPLEQTN